ncbi:MAG: glycosyltransferase family 4 protein [bacterium]|nr:glycosyltransferase family 4 protein [bacterium]
MRILITAGSNTAEAKTLLEILSQRGHFVQIERASANSTFKPDAVICYDSTFLSDGAPALRVRAFAEGDGNAETVVFSGESSVPQGFAGRYQIIPNAVDMNSYKPASRNNGLLLFAPGKLDPESGHRTLMQAMTRVSNDISVVIAGNEGYYTVEQMQGYSEMLGIEDRVNFVTEGWKAVQFREQAAAGVVTSLGGQPVPHSLIEIMACALPLLTTADGSICDFASDGVNCLFHSPGNAKQLAGQINYLMENPGVAEMLGTNGRKYCETNLSFESVGHRWTEILEQLVFN